MKNKKSLEYFTAYTKKKMQKPHFFNSFMSGARIETNPLSKSMDWFLYDNGPGYERVKTQKYCAFFLLQSTFKGG